jgi:biopolymer transport protein TolR
MRARTPVRTPRLDTINITPLVDVCLVILLIFMVVTPMLAPGHPVELPRANHSSPQPEEKHAITLSVDAAGAIYLETTPVDVTQLTDSLNASHAEDPDRAVRVMGDGRAPFGEVKDVLRASRSAGFSKIALIVKQRSDTVQAAMRDAEDDTPRKEVPHERSR